jgi:hypothetical protein
MHSYANGTGSDKRKQNWILLKKFFRKYNYPVSDADITNILYTKESSIQALIDLLFTTLTNKPVQRAQVPEDPTALLKIPSYALPTASVAISNQFMEPHLRDQQDFNTLAASAAEAVADTKSLHEQQQVLRHVYRDEPLPMHVLGGVARMGRTPASTAAPAKTATGASTAAVAAGSRAVSQRGSQRQLVSSRSASIGAAAAASASASGEGAPVSTGSKSRLSSAKTGDVDASMSRTQAAGVAVAVPAGGSGLGLPDQEKQESGATIPSISNQQSKKSLNPSLSVTMPRSESTTSVTPQAAVTPVARVAPAHGYTLRGEMAPVPASRPVQPPLAVESVKITVVKGEARATAATPVSSRDWTPQQI